MKRFFRDVGVVHGEDGFRVTLDGRPLKTPAKKVLALSSRTWADALAAEWAALGVEFEPTQMVLTKCANTAIDHVAGNEATVITSLLGNYSDLICYRAAMPDALVSRQAAGWDPLVDWARETLGVVLSVGVGAAFVEQPQTALAGLRIRLERFDALGLTALSGVAVILGSMVLALSIVHGRLSAEEAFALSRIDDAFQNERWGVDEEAQARTNALLAELKTLSAVLQG